MKRMILAAVFCAIAAPAVARPPAVVQEGPSRDEPAAVQAAPAATRFDRANPETWRGRPEWADFKGVREGYWFAPGYGYQAVDPRWAGHAWRRGDVLGAGDRIRYVQTPAFYGLRPAPLGYRWIYYNGNLLLAEVATGLVGQVVTGVY